MTVKHTPSTDALETLGNVIMPSEKRDAIHLAVDPAFSTEYLNPGDHVRIIGKSQVARCAVGAGHGIVDPFLKRSINPGEWFWLVVYPREITSLRHVWSHPAFEDEPTKNQPGPEYGKMTPEQIRALTVAAMETSMVEPATFAALGAQAFNNRPAQPQQDVDEINAQQWIQNFADDCGLDYDELMEAAADYLSHGDYLIKGGDLEGYYVSDEFWDKYQIVKKEKVDENDRGSFFSCSC